MERECPYGADDCPKLEKLDAIEHEMHQQRETLLQLISSFKTFAWICGVLIALLTGTEVII